MTRDEIRRLLILLESVFCTAPTIPLGLCAEILRLRVILTNDTDDKRTLQPVDVSSRMSRNMNPMTATITLTQADIEQAVAEWVERQGFACDAASVKFDASSKPTVLVVTATCEVTVNVPEPTKLPTLDELSASAINSYAIVNRAINTAFSGRCPLCGEPSAADGIPHCLKHATERISSPKTVRTTDGLGDYRVR